ncbi:MAG: threonine aldolase [Epulopiscium sp. Nuni2H_MBin001]|nr:MAG: threonine aldolase [Epulopiscium sp. Nuni2H_MBin001]
MYKFKNDYSEGAHPSIIEEMIKTNLDQTVGYGEDKYCESARELIKAHIKHPNADIHFFIGGTQTNLTAISAFLRPHEAVIAADTAHIQLHEAGAIEATGHSIINVKHRHGKIEASQVENVLKHHLSPHMTKAKMVYISNATEYGTLYSKAELHALSKVCKENNLILYIDGARLGVALTANNNDLTMQDIANYADAFYIGGTKNGAIFGEALVITNPSLQDDFKYFMKQRGALLAKGRFLGIQFNKLFEQDLFYELATHANKMAAIINDTLIEKNYKVFVPTETNQLFPILSHAEFETLSKKFDFEMWEPFDDLHYVTRFVTSWATTEEGVKMFVEALANLRN